MSGPAQAPFELIEPCPEHADELGRICYEAFKDIADAHRFPPDFPNVQVARRMMRGMIGQPGTYGVAAISGGELLGSNFMMLSDPVGGVGPITVDCAAQGRNVGRALMADVIRHARENNIAMVRLVQDAYNTASISLYASLGFETRHPLALMRPVPAETADSSIRDATETDLDAMDELCRRIYKVTRRNEVANAIRHRMPVLVRVRDGRIRAYTIPMIFGHGVGESEEDLVMLAREAARRSPETCVVFAPLEQHQLFRQFLGAGFRTVKMMNLMTMGPYEPPSGLWMPSVAY